MIGLIARVLAAIRIVCPSAADLAASSMPIIWPAPGRLSTTNCCPSDSESFCARARAMMSVPPPATERSEEHTSELQSPCNLVCRLLLEKKKKNKNNVFYYKKKKKKKK